ncbi:hypothetical protein [Mesorhizobium sp. 10J20-29]
MAGIPVGSSVRRAAILDLYLDRFGGIHDARQICKEVERRYASHASD